MHTHAHAHTHALFNRDKGSLNISIQTRRGALISSEGRHLPVRTHVHATTNDAEGKSEGKTRQFQSSPPSSGGNHLLTLPSSACLRVINYFRPSCRNQLPRPRCSSRSSHKSGAYRSMTLAFLVFCSCWQCGQEDGGAGRMPMPGSVSYTSAWCSSTVLCGCTTHIHTCISQVYPSELCNQDHHNAQCRTGMHLTHATASSFL